MPLSFLKPNLKVRSYAHFSEALWDRLDRQPVGQTMDRRSLCELALSELSKSHFGPFP